MATPSLPVLNLTPSADIPPQIKQEPIPPADEIVVRIDTSTQPQRDQEAEEEQPQFLESLNSLVSLSSAIHAFQSRYKDLQSHLDSIRGAIDSGFKDPNHPKAIEIETEKNLAVSKDLGGESCGDAKPSRSEIRYLCETMSSRELRRLIAGHLSDLSMLRKEVPEGLKIAPKPAKLVSECVGRFYLQGKKAYTKDSHMIVSRRAAVLILECFLSILGSCGEEKIEIDEFLKDDMQEGAIAWKKRLITEGGLAHACEMDARGLLFLILCFGIPSAFEGEDIGHLLRLCNMRENLDALKGSPALLAKMPDIIESMAKRNFLVEAIDIACSFGIEDKYPPLEILTMALRESEESHKKEKQDAKNSPIAMKQLKEKQLAVLKSVAKYVEDRRPDLAEVFGRWKIKEKMAKLEKEISDIDKQIEGKAAPKRKADQSGLYNKVNGRRTKHLHVAAQEPPLLTYNVNGFHEQRAAALASAMRSHGTVAPSPLEGGISSHVYSHPALNTAGPGRLTASPYAGGGHGEVGVPRLMRSAADAVDAALIEKYLGQTSSAKPASSVVPAGLYGPSRGAPDRTMASHLYRFADVAEGESSLPSYHRPYMR